MKLYTTSRKLTATAYDGLKPDQAQALFQIAEAGKEGLTDAQLAAIQVDEAGQVVESGGTPLKVKQALLFTGFVQAVSVPGERKGSERTYQYTGVQLGDDLSPALKKISAAVAARGQGTKTQFAEELVKASQAESDAAVAAGNEALEVLTIEKATKNVNGVWLRLQDRGIIAPINKKDLVEQSNQEAAPAVEAGVTGTDDAPYIEQPVE